MTESDPGVGNVKEANGEAQKAMRRNLTVIVVSISAILGVIFFYYTASAWLLFFAAVLLAILLRSTSDRVSAATGMSGSTSLAVTVISILISFGLIAWLLESRIEMQWSDFNQQLTRGMRQAEEYLKSQSWEHEFRVDVPKFRDVFFSSGAFGNIPGVLSNSIGLVIDVIVVLFLSLYLAMNPSIYREGILHLLPQNARHRAAEIFDALGHTLLWWFIGRLLSMSVVGVMTGIGLWLVGNPLPFTLGLLTGLMNFVPNFGPAVATVLTGLVGLSASPIVALLSVCAQFIIGGFDGFVTTPLIQQRTVSLPAGIILGSQVIGGILFGALGVMLATPLAATVLVLTRKLYVNDFLGDKSV